MLTRIITTTWYCCCCCYEKKIESGITPRMILFQVIQRTISHHPQMDAQPVPRVSQWLPQSMPWACGTSPWPGQDSPARPLPAPLPLLTARTWDCENSLAQSEHSLATVKHWGVLGVLLLQIQTQPCTSYWEDNWLNTSWNQDKHVSVSYYLHC